MKRVKKKRIWKKNLEVQNLEEKLKVRDIAELICGAEA